MRLLVTAVLLLTSQLVFGQKFIRGIVVDDVTKELIVGVTVFETGTTNGTITDEAGRFFLTMKKEGSLTFQHVGYSKREIIPESENLYVSLSANYQLENIIIRGVRAKSKDPIVQTNIPKEQVEKVYTGQHPIFLLEEFTPSVYSYSESGTSVGNYGQMRLRGMNQERINFSLNGVPLNDMIDQGVFFSNFTDVSSSFESIQVQRGVGTSSAGVSSYAGSVNFETINVAKADPFSTLSLGAGSFGTYRANFQTNTGVQKNGFGFYSSLSKFWSEGYRDFTESDATSMFLTGGYYGERNLFRMTTFYSRSQNGLGYYTIDRSILDQNPTFNNLTEDDNDDFQQYMVQMQHSIAFSDQVTLSSTLYYSGAGGDFGEGTPDVDSIFVENYGAQYPINFFQINYPLQNDHYGLINNLLINLADVELTIGSHIYQFDRENREEYAPQFSQPYYRDQTQKREAAVFVKSNYQLSNKTSIFADVQLRHLGLQFTPDYSFIFGDDFNRIDITSPKDLKWTFLNPRVGFNYEINEALSLFTSYGRSYREPTRIDLLGGFQLNISNYELITRDPEFKPESVDDFELGLKWNQRRIALDANLYYMNFTNEIAPIGEVIAFGVQKRVNIDRSYRMGFEGAMNYLLSNALSLQGSFAFQKAVIRELLLEDQLFEDKQQILSPEVILNFGLNYTPVKGLNMNPTMRVLSESYMEYTNDPAFVVPSSVVFDLNLGYEFRSWNIGLLVNNLLDVEYFTFGTPSDVDFSGILEPGFYVQAPRNYFLKTSYTF
jgi:iron complex outermembrane receptor protein